MLNWLLYFVTVFIWGSTWIAIKFQLGEVAPEVSIFYRFVLAASLLLLYCLFRNISLRFSPKNHALLALLGACMFSLHYIFVYNATFYLISGLISVIFSLVGLCNILNNYLFFKAKPTKLILGGAAVGLVGILTIFYPDLCNISFQNTVLLGICLALVGMLIFSLGNVVSRISHIRGMRLVSSTAIAMSYGVLIMGAYILTQGIPFTGSDRWIYWASLLYLAIPGSIVAFLCYLSLIARIGLERAGYATVFFPVVALVFSFFLENYQWTLHSVLGIGLVILGNYLIMFKKQKT